VTSQAKYPDHPILEEGYKAELTVRIGRELLKGPCDFACLVRGAEGAYPSDVLAVLRQLETAGEACVTSAGDWKRCGLLNAASQRTPEEAEPEGTARTCLPEPHPLDFDWRFSESTLAALQRRMDVSQDEAVAILGAPTLYKHLVDSGVDAWLFDKNAQIIEHLRDAGYTSVTQGDLFEFTAAPRRFHCVVADPPWYIEHYRAFLEAGHSMLLPDGRILMSVLPRLTRPSASSDRFHVLEIAARFGFDLIEVSPGALHYESPPFEVEALRAEGLALGAWRNGDLFTFAMCSRPPQIEEPRTKPVAERWDSIPFGQTTVKIKVEHSSSREPFDYKAASSTGSLRLRSVSRRSPVRSRINFWTSRNVALTITKPQMVAELLRKVAGGGVASEAVAVIAYEYQLSDKEIDRLRQLIELLDSEASLR